MKKLIVLLLMILPLGVFAQEMKVAIVNSQELIMALPDFAQFQKTMATFESEYNTELKRLQDEYEKKYKDYVAQQDSLTENIKVRRMQELQDIEQRTQNFMQVTQQEAQKKSQDLLAPIQEKVKKAIKEVGDEKGFTYIMDMNPQIILYTGNSAIDATPLVRTKLGL